MSLNARGVRRPVASRGAAKPVCKDSMFALGVAFVITSCSWAANGPQTAWQGKPIKPMDASIQVGVSVPAGLNAQSLKTGYRTQYVGSDVQDVVVGLFDASSSPNLAGIEWTGGTPTDNTITSNATWTHCSTTGDTDVTPNYLATMMGCSAPGLIDPSGKLGLLQSDYQNASRWLVVRKGASITGWNYSGGTNAYFWQKVTFGNLNPNHSYYLFAEAFLIALTDTTPATASLTDPNHNDVAGVATESVTGLTPNGTLQASTLSMNLDFAESTVSVPVTITEATPSGTLQ